MIDHRIAWLDETPLPEGIEVVTDIMASDYVTRVHELMTYEACIHHEPTGSALPLYAVVTTDSDHMVLVAVSAHQATQQWIVKAAMEGAQATTAVQDNGDATPPPRVGPQH